MTHKASGSQIPAYLICFHHKHPKATNLTKQHLKLFEHVAALMNHYLSHTVGLKARLLALYFTVPS